MAVKTGAPASGAVLVVLFVVALLEGFDLQIAGLVAEGVAREFALGSVDLGVFFSTALAGTFFGSFLGGALADHSGRRKALLVAMAVFGLACLATGWASTYPMLLVLRFLAGLGFGAATPCFVALAAEAGGERPGRAVALIYAGMPLGGALMSLMAMAGLVADWRTPFVTGGILPLIATALVWRIVPADRPRTRDEDKPQDQGWADLLRGPQASVTLLICLAIPIGLMVPNFFLNWLPKLMLSIGVTPAQAALVQLCNNFGAATGCLVAGWVVIAMRPGLRVLQCFGGLALALLVFPSLAGSFVVAAIGAFVVGGAVQCSQAILLALAPQCFPASLRGRGVGTALGCGRIGAMLGPMLGGLLIGAGMAPLSIVYATIPAVILSGALALTLFRRLAPGQQAAGPNS